MELVGTNWAIFINIKHVTTLITNVDYSNDFDCSNDFGCPNDFECSIYYCSNFLYFGLDHRRDGLHPNKCFHKNDWLCIVDRWPKKKGKI